MTILKITPQDTYPIRHQVMWPDKPIEYVQLEEDQHGLHFGVYHNSQLVSVVSLFIDGDQAQFRKFATLEHVQGKGYGSALLQHLVNEAHNYNIRTLWCNARASKTGFYKKAGFHTTDKTFVKDGMPYVVMEKHIR